MKIRFFPALVLFASMAGCASTPDGTPRIARATPEQMERAVQSAPQPMFIEDIVELSRTGTPPEEIIRRYADSRTRLKLSDAQKLDMRKRGVDQRVIDHIVQAEAEAERTDRITAQVDRERAARNQSSYYYGSPYYSPYYGPRIYPYTGFGWSRWGSGWYGGIGLGF